MAILKGLIRKMRGSAGDFTFRKSDSRTVVSEKATEVSNPKSSAQQKHRMKWANIVKMYHGIIPLLDSAFENKADGVNDFNMFVKFNMQMKPVYLTKSQVAGGACVVAPYVISQGSLPMIQTTGVGANAVTDIKLGTLVINAQTTVAQFANAVVANNEDYNYGDQISFFRIEQRVNGASDIPYGVFKAHSVVLDKMNNALLLGQVPAEGFTVVNGKLGHLASVAGDYAYAWVHSRRTSDGIKVSSQTLIDNNSLLSEFTSEDAYRKAVDSYGGERKIFLSPIAVESVNDEDLDGDNPGGGSGSGNGSGSGSGSGSGDNPGGGNEGDDEDDDDDEGGSTGGGGSY